MQEIYNFPTEHVKPEKATSPLKDVLKKKHTLR